jgi:septation ring formation regulator EzrA
MRGSEARRPIPDNQPYESPMESRIAVVENDIGNIKDNIAKLFDGMKTANDSITKLLTGQAETRGDINTLRADINGRMEALEKKITQWFFATALSCAALAFSVTKLFN